MEEEPSLTIQQQVPSTEEDDTSAASSTGDWSDTNKKDQHVVRISQSDIETFQRLDDDFELALEEREISYTARYNSVRQSACFSVVFMVMFLTLGTVFFLHQADWTIADSLLFSIYTITTVGYGNLEHPQTAGFQLYVICFIFIGIATLTILVSQIYQCLALEATRAQHARDFTEMSRRGHFLAAKKRTKKLRGSGGSDTVPTVVETFASSENGTNEEIIMPLVWKDHLLEFVDRARIFFRNHEIGRAVSVMFPFIGLILIGAIVIGPIEGWSVVESLYFAVVSLTTVGFGDYYPTRQASILFCILWLPFSIGFMSLFLANVAAFYIRLSDKNIERIEQHLRRHIQRSKEQIEMERREARKRALRGQVHLSDLSVMANGSDDLTVEMGDMHVDGSKVVSEGPTESVSAQSTVLRKRRGFDTVPTNDGVDEDDDRSDNSSQKLFGSALSPMNRRERILRNSDNYSPVRKAYSRQRSGNSSEFDDETRPAGSTMTTMREVLRAIRLQIATEEEAADTGGFHVTSRPESSFLSIRSSKPIIQSLERNSILKPCFALRALVQERFSEIIAIDLAGYSSSIEIHDNSLTVTIDVLKETADKWLVPRRARKAFRATTFETLYFVGEHGLITRGANALYDLTPYEFHALFAPLLAAMGDAETMEVWLASTDSLAEFELQPDPARRLKSKRATRPCKRPEDSVSSPSEEDCAEIRTIS
jgi:hypothetical protein